MKKLASFFLQGLLMVTPLLITGYVIYIVFDDVDGILKNMLAEYFGRSIPGLGLVILIVLITLLGFLGQTFIAKPIRFLVGKFLDKAPIVKLIYTSFSDLMTAFVGKERKFNKPVLVLINKENDLWKVGFMTQKSMKDFGLEDKVAVYFPYAYSVAGDLLIVPATSIKKLDISPAEVMKFAVSGGVTRVM